MAGNQKLSAILIMLAIGSILLAVFSVLADHGKIKALTGVTDEMLNNINVMTFGPAVGTLFLGFGNIFDHKGFSILGSAWIILPMAYVGIATQNTLLDFVVTMHKIYSNDHGSDDKSDLEQLLNGIIGSLVCSLVACLFAVLSAHHRYRQERDHEETSRFSSQNLVWKLSLAISFILAVVGGSLLWTAQSKADDDAESLVFWLPSLGMFPFIILAFTFVALRYASVITNATAVFLAGYFILSTFTIEVSKFWQAKKEKVENHGLAYTGAAMGIVSMLLATFCILFHRVDRASQEADNIKREYEEKVFTPLDLTARPPTWQQKMGKIRAAIVLVGIITTIMSFVVTISSHRPVAISHDTSLKALVRKIQGSIGWGIVPAAACMLALFKQSSPPIIFALACSTWLVCGYIEYAFMINNAENSIYDQELLDFFHKLRNCCISGIFGVSISLLGLVPYDINNLLTNINGDRVARRRRGSGRRGRFRVIIRAIFVVAGSALWWYGMDQNDPDNRNALPAYLPIGTIFMLFGSMYALTYRSLLLSGPLFILGSNEIFTLLSVMLQTLPYLEDSVEEEGGIIHHTELYWGARLLLAANIWLVVYLLFFIRLGDDNYGDIASTYSRSTGGGGTSFISARNNSDYFSGGASSQKMASDYDFENNNPNNNHHYYHNSNNNNNNNNNNSYDQPPAYHEHVQQQSYRPPPTNPSAY